MCGLNAISGDSIYRIGCGLDAIIADFIHFIGCSLNAIIADFIHLIWSHFDSLILISFSEDSMVILISQLFVAPCIHKFTCAHDHFIAEDEQY